MQGSKHVHSPVLDSSLVEWCSYESSGCIGCNPASLCLRHAPNGLVKHVQLGYLMQQFRDCWM
jgi:hypothetical protein